VCSPSAQAGAAYVTGAMVATSTTFSYNLPDALKLSTVTTASLHNCTFAAAYAANGDLFIYAAGVHIDYGNCTPGQSPGLTGANVPGSRNFTGCPFACVPGTFGPGGEFDALQALPNASTCAVGCKDCPAGAVCDALALPAPNYCEAGHYNPDQGSQTEGSCRPCERYD